MHYGLAFFPTDYAILPADLAAAGEERGLESLWFAEHSHIPVSPATGWDSSVTMSLTWWPRR